MFMGTVEAPGGGGTPSTEQRCSTELGETLRLKLGTERTGELAERPTGAPMHHAGALGRDEFRQVPY